MNPINVSAFKVSQRPATDVREHRIVITNCQTGAKSYISGCNDSCNLSKAIAFIEGKYEVTIVIQFNFKEDTFLITR